MIAKIIAAGRDRDEALARLHRALSQMTVVVDGGTTNRSFLLDLLERPEVRAGDVDTSWLDRLTAADGHLPTRHADVALVVAALDAVRRSPPPASARRSSAGPSGAARRPTRRSAGRSSCATAASPTRSSSASWVPTASPSGSTASVSSCRPSGSAAAGLG